jgi:hypothetical protein
MTVCKAISLLKLPYIHRICVCMYGYVEPYSYECRACICNPCDRVRWTRTGSKLKIARSLFHVTLRTSHCAFRTTSHCVFFTTSLCPSCAHTTLQEACRDEPSISPRHRHMPPLLCALPLTQRDLSIILGGSGESLLSPALCSQGRVGCDGLCSGQCGRENCQPPTLL